MAAQIFLTTIRGARRHDEFTSIPFNEQNTILRKGWAALFLLRASTWPYIFDHFHTSSASGKLGLIFLTTSRNAILKLLPDDVEFSALQTLLLCRKGE